MATRDAFGSNMSAPIFAPPLAGHVIMLGRVLQRVSNIDDTVQVLDPEGRVA